MMRKFLSIIMVITVLCVNLCGCSSNGDDTIRIGYHTNYGGSGAVLIAVENGYFEEQGLNVELVAFASGPPEIAALNNGTIDFAYIGQGSHSLAINGMAEIICIQNISDAEAIIVNKTSGISTLEDLKGKTVAALFGTSSEDMLIVALASVGLSTGDVNMKNYDMAGAITALENGDVDAICVWEEYRFEAVSKLGDNALVLATTGDFSDVYAPLSSWVTTQEMIDEDSETTQKFVTAIMKAQNYWAYNTEETCELISDKLDISLVNLLLGKDMTDLFTIKEISDYLESDYIMDLYRMQQEYLIMEYEGISPRAVDEYVWLEFMENAVVELS
ncbi:MAG: ABC transporter substrate-binding protein [Bacillota bacterium]